MIRDYEFLKEQINYCIQNSGLDIGAAYFIMKEVLRNLESAYYAQINKEFAEHPLMPETSEGSEAVAPDNKENNKETE